MSRPELQSYITQARAAGQTNEQIRSALLAQGWPMSEIDKLLGPIQTGVPAFVPQAPLAATPVPPGMGSGAKLLIGFLLLAMVGVGAYLVFRNMLTNSTAPVGSKSEVDAATLAGASGSEKICGDWPASEKAAPDDFGYADIFQPKNAAEYQGDFPVYPGSAYVGKLSILKSAVFCSSADVKTIFNYYQSYNAGTTWKLSSLRDEYRDWEGFKASGDTAQSSFLPAWTTNIQQVHLDRVSGTQGLLAATIFASGGKTVILMTEVSSGQ